MSEKIHIWVAVFLGPEGNWCAAGAKDETPEGIERSWSLINEGSITERRLVTMEMDPPKAPDWLQINFILDETDPPAAAETDDNKMWREDARKVIAMMSAEDKAALIAELGD